MATDPDALLAMADGERLAALRAMSPEDRAALDERLRAGRVAAYARYGPTVLVMPSDQDPPDIELH
ncbi:MULTISPECIES: hypothetical protein [unclassified Streptomyces]|uniref:hypothetical protein n=1 Tax=unclassified Streptomyces TaxID=2593676 RepID=UPI002E2A88B8|nr:hypothetical protein [Streptomyces sp. NBC_00223]